MPSIEAIGKMLIEKGIVNEEDFKEASEQSRQMKTSLFTVLIDSGFAEEESIYKFLEEKYQIPFLSLEHYQIDKGALNMIPEDVANQMLVIPLFESGDDVVVAASYPLDIYTRDYIQGLTKYRVSQVLSTKKDILGAIKRLYITVESSVVNIASITRMEESDEKESYLKDLIKEAEKAPVVKLVSFILTQAIEHKASDIHIEPFIDKSILRYRVDGSLYDYPAPPLTMHRAIVSRIKIISDLDIAERRLPQTGRAEIKVKDRTVDLRVSIIPTIHGENVVIRVLDKSSVRLELENLGFDENFIAKLKVVIARPNGVILVTGPTGSGKTSTLYSILQRLHDPRKKIITIEDPIEFDFVGVSQIPVRPEIGLTFAQALRSVLRHDPDIIMVGEMRDLESSEIGIRCALTGHLVLSTLHTNDAPSAATRLEDMGIPPFLISSTLIASMAQRLVRKLCSYCRELYTPSRDILEEIGVKPNNIKNFQFYTTKGCARCNRTGYSGRSAIGELFILNEHLRTMINENVSSSTLKQAAQRYGMETLRQNAFHKFKNGITSWDEVLNITAADEEVKV
ncbi:MAG: Flp pilus assembly complex ATPase component TadA [Candidatus Eremiobacteraeota bacterium]|nr:Flp pilus assembly complex ATPase component TadA [Candidatus Eremiobacteraeota bacterium]